MGGTVTVVSNQGTVMMTLSVPRLREKMTQLPVPAFGVEALRCPVSNLTVLRFHQKTQTGPHDVIHTVGPIARGHLNGSHKEDLAKCYRSSLKLVKENNIRSVSLCQLLQAVAP
ncbi:hypothetical protein E5288_WYG019269 [Bos mutus]|uniref:Macro domain-containing protein n=1 Tax=Bos mutus TaxID=72004 RepID=A0A6B0S9M5_9CETA|nr:hypothetical protein [Bos mutus]